MADSVPAEVPRSALEFEVMGRDETAGAFRQIYAPLHPPSSAEAKVPQGRATRWRRVLLGREDGSQQPFSQWHGKLDEQNQRVIKGDCERTRADVEYFRRPDIRAKMEAMLTCWCQQQRARYKQGLNEVLAPFLYLQTEPGSAAPNDDEVFACFSAFLRRFVPFFDSDDFVPLQCSFVFFRRLLLYHRPDLHNLLAERGVSPDMFCMPWFLTLFASKMPLRLTLQLWDRHLERGEPPFFVFLAAAVLVNSEQAILSAEASSMPEILTHLGLSSREELESMWSVAEGLYQRTPATFATRLRRNVLRISVDFCSKRPISRNGGGRNQEVLAKTTSPRGQEEKEDSKQTYQIFERLDQESCFFILPEEVVGHCYPLRPAEVRKRWQPSTGCPWRLIILDTRPHDAFESARLPCALHFDVSSASSTGVQGPWAAGRRILRSGFEPAPKLEPVQVFEVLKATLGEDWVCDREAHICLLGGAEDSKLIRSLYEVLTNELTLRHVSAASGGFQAVAACAEKHGYEMVTGEPSPWAVRSHPKIVEGAPAAGSARSTNKKVLAPTGGSGQSSTTATCGVEGTIASGPPALKDRPGNWPAESDLSILPAKWRKDLCTQPAIFWRCIAVVVRCPEPLGRGWAASPLPPAATSPAWEGCMSLLALTGGRLVCAEAGTSRQARVFAEFDVARVLKVTSKKHAPDVLIFYFRTDDPAGPMAAPPTPDFSGGDPSPEPAMVLHFVDGADDVKGFIKVLSGSYAELPATAPPGGSGPPGSDSSRGRSATPVGTPAGTESYPVDRRGYIGEAARVRTPPRSIALPDGLGEGHQHVPARLL